MDVYEEKIVSGYEGRVRGGAAGFGFEKYRRGEKVDPKQQAVYYLNKVLEKYPEFTKEARTEIQLEFANFPNIAVVNLEALAAVLNFLKMYPNPTPEDFKDEIILEFFERLIPDKPISSEEKGRLIIRLKAQFLKYIVAIKTFRNPEEIEEE